MTIPFLICDLLIFFREKLAAVTLFFLRLPLASASRISAIDLEMYDIRNINNHVIMIRLPCLT